MKELGEIAAAWRAAEQAGEDAILATVVEVHGSSYRRPGGRLLLTSSGRRRGAISGGCLEGDLAKKAWWLTAEGRAVVRTYDTAADADGPADFGLGCNGVIHVLIERLRPAEQALPVAAIEQSRRIRRRSVLATVIRSHDAALVGRHAAVLPGDDEAFAASAIPSAWRHWLEDQATEVLRTGVSNLARIEDSGGYLEVFVEAIDPPIHLLLFGGGDDAFAVTDQAKLLGWRVTVLDGRSTHARAERFPQADAVVVNTLDDPLKGVTIDKWTIAVVMTHSLSQDSAALRELARHQPGYVGVLGPHRRTVRLLEIAGLESQVLPDTWHSPVGLDLGGDTPEQVALAIVAEAHAVIEGRSPRKLRDRSGPIHETTEPRTEEPYVSSSIVCA